MPKQDQIVAFIDKLANYDGFAPFSDAKLPINLGSDRIVVIADGDEVTAIGAIATHTQSDGSVRVALETAVQPVMRFPAFEGAALDASLRAVDGSLPLSVWSSRSSLDAALGERGFMAARVLDFMVVDLPIEAQVDDDRIRGFLPSDLEAMVSVNRAAFEGHREAASLDTGEMGRYRSEPWFNEEGIFIAESGGVAGFCWTRVHPNGDGEIFRIGVAPVHQGSGLGSALLKAGFDYLAHRSDVARGVLWVDRSNVAAIGLYASMGMERERSNAEFTPG
jgi:mycothiol synthase